MNNKIRSDTLEESHRFVFNLNDFVANNETSGINRPENIPKLNDTVSLRRDTLTRLSAYHPARTTRLNDLAEALETRFKHTGQISDLDEAVSLRRGVLDGLPPYHALRTTQLNNLATVLHVRFEQTDQLLDIDEAISLFREFVARLPAYHGKKLLSINNLAAALGTRFQQMGQQKDLDEAISLLRDAILVETYHTSHTSLLNNLAAALGTRFQRTGWRPDLDEAILLFRKVVASRAASHPHYTSSLSNLAGALQTRSEQNTQFPDLDEAISLNRKALALRPTPYPDRPFLLISLAATLRVRFEQTGQLTTLDEAISLSREALGLIPLSNLAQSHALYHLANTLQSRFHQTGQAVDLNDAISLHREALALRPPSHPDHWASINSVANALMIRSRQTGQLSDLDEAISLHYKALALCSLPHPGRWSSLNNLAVAFRFRFEQKDHLADLDKAILLHRDALILVPASNINRPLALNNLSIVLTTRFEKTGQGSDLEEALNLCRQALQEISRDHPSVCNFSRTLSRLLQHRICLARVSEDTMVEKASDGSLDMLEAVEALRAAVHCESAPVAQRFAAARDWAQLSDSLEILHESALEAYQTAIGFLPRLAMLGLDLESRRQALTLRTDGLARDAAACAIRLGKFIKAIELLEEGRAIFWSQALQLRTRLVDLQTVEPELAQRLKNIAHALEQGALREVSLSTADRRGNITSTEMEAIHYRQLNTDWLATVEEVRRLDGFGEFLRPKSFATLAAAAAKGPVVILIARRLNSECDALIVNSSRDPIHVPLPQFTARTAEELVKKIRVLPDASFPMARGESDRHMYTSLRKREDADDIFRTVLASLWKSVVHPILHSMTLEKSDLPPRLWWLPTGPFSSLPIHASGRYDGQGSDCVSDYVVSSYTPTLTALLTSPPLTPEKFKMLAVIQPFTKGQAPLPCTKEELQKIEEHVPDESLAKFGIPGTPSLKQNVLSDLPNAMIVHFACHGIQNPRDPLESALLLEDEELTVSQLMQLSIPNASLVFLSACQTAMIDSRLPDEPIHLAATLLFSGFRGAVATMWSIKDRDGPTIADCFYRQLFSIPKSTMKDTPRASPDTTQAAYALHLAVGELRDKLHVEKAQSQFIRWVPFIHIGQ